MILRSHDVHGSETLGAHVSTPTCDQLLARPQVSNNGLSRCKEHGGELICSQFTIGVSSTTLIPRATGYASFSNRIMIHERVGVFVHHRKNLSEDPLIDVDANACNPFL